MHLHPFSSALKCLKTRSEGTRIRELIHKLGYVSLQFVPSVLILPDLARSSKIVAASMVHIKEVRTNLVKALFAFRPFFVFCIDWCKTSIDGPRHTANGLVYGFLFASFQYSASLPQAVQKRETIFRRPASTNKATELFHKFGQGFLPDFLSVLLSRSSLVRSSH
jgi:hypothetical protein